MKQYTRKKRKSDIMPGKLFACALARCHRSMCGAFMLIVRKKNFPILGMMVLIPLFPVIENLKR